jgi:hypothetical protein
MHSCLPWAVKILDLALHCRKSNANTKQSVSAPKVLASSLRSLVDKWTGESRGNVRSTKTKVSQRSRGQLELSSLVAFFKTLCGNPHAYRSCDVW